MRCSFNRLFRALLILQVLLIPALLSQDVSTLYIFKAAWYEQNTGEDPVLFPQAEDPFDFTALAYLSDELLSDPDWGLWISGMTVRTPGGRTEGMNLDPASGTFEFYEGAVTAQVLNQRYGAGNYRFTLSSVITGNSTYDVPLAAEDYPPAPKITNFDAAQKVDPTRDFTLRWTDFTGGGEREIWLEIVDKATFGTAFVAGPLGGDDTSVVIPGGTFQADTAYIARLSFTRYTHSSVGTVPETYSGFEAYNAISLLTKSGGSPVDPPTITGWRVLENGDLELTANCTPNRSLTVQGAAAVKAAWSTLQTTNPTASPAMLILPKTSLGNPMFIRVYQE